MVSLPLYDKTGKQLGSFEVDPEAIAPRISKQLLHDAVVMYQANLRQGSAKSKTRAEVAGAKKKMYRQKGTGNARAGHKRSGVRRGGGHIFAKQPKSWYYRLPRKALQSATRMAIASKINENNVTLIDELKMDAPKTKAMAGVLGALNLSGSLLIAIDTHDVNTYKSARNIAGVRILPVAELNAFEILRPRKLLMTKAALENFVRKEN
ncbi:MAG: 50S ribosomal protein L4 [Planctomycetaceae bacterium]|nr:50S ribosomal protein L4 [Planctomycetaceae bacterium]